MMILCLCDINYIRLGSKMWSWFNGFFFGFFFVVWCRVLSFEQRQVIIQGLFFFRDVMEFGGDNMFWVIQKGVYFLVIDVFMEGVDCFGKFWGVYI